MRCYECGQVGFHPDEVTRTFTVDDRVVVVEGIPAQVCDGCGAATFSADVGEQLRRMVREPQTPTRVIQADVLQFHAA